MKEAETDNTYTKDHEKTINNFIKKIGQPT